MWRDLPIKSRSSWQKKRLNLNIPRQQEIEDMTQAYLFSPYYTSVLEIVNDLAATSLFPRIILERIHLTMKEGENLWA